MICDALLQSPVDERWLKHIAVEERDDEEGPNPDWPHTIFGTPPPAVADPFNPVGCSQVTQKIVCACGKPLQWSDPLGCWCMREVLETGSVECSWCGSRYHVACFGQ
eukprot:Sspe_Gene.59785::Locus_32869_Transcript_4_9_Confidence_0.556_Length_660::g.59785::m.59785